MSSSTSTASSDTAVEEPTKRMPSLKHLSPMHLLIALTHWFSPVHLLLSLTNLLYRFYQIVVTAVFAAPYVPFTSQQRRGRIAVIGAGLTGRLYLSLR
jgi:hypothetical protein